MSEAKGNPIPVRLEPEDRSDVEKYSNETGLPSADIIRRCVRFAIPEFISGRADVLKYGKKKKPQADPPTTTAVPKLETR